jgi:acyl-homoserine-lactone acylase
MNNHWPRVFIMQASLLLGLFAATTTAGAAPRGYEAQITRTHFGVPHIYADSYSNLGFGLGYAFAEDNYCVLANEILSVRSQEAELLGDAAEHVESDFYYAIVAVRERAASAWPKYSRRVQQLLEGYAAGLNRYRARTDETFQRECPLAEWVGDITPLDLVAHHISIALYVSSEPFRREMVAAAPPVDGSRAAPASAFVPTPRVVPAGSNAWAIGDGGDRFPGALLLANPHFPWQGAKRFYMSHLVIPGQLDVMGASLFGVPTLQIGFNRDVAWTHTVSTSARAVIYQLELDPQNSRRYKLDNRFVDMLEKQVTIRVKAEGGYESRSRTFYSSELGPIIASQRGLQWSGKHAYALADANAGNALITPQWLALNRADSVKGVLDSIAAVRGAPWVNTIAADRHGDVLYVDSSRVPRISNETLHACFASPAAAQHFAKTALAILDGSRRQCRSMKDGAVEVFPLSQAPQLRGSDYVANSNNSHWLPHTQHRLEGYPRLYGSERSPLNLRARLSLSMLEDLMRERAQLTVAQLESALFNGRTLGAELMLKDVVGFCRSNEGTGDGAQACATLQAWDQKDDPSSAGAHLFREIVMNLREGGEERLFSVPFDPQDPIATPRGPILDRQLLGESIAGAARLLTRSSIALDAKLQEIQFVERGTERISVPGGFSQTGAFNVVDGQLIDARGYQVRSGSSFIMLVSMQRSGPKARGILTYSQSARESSPHFSDQSRLYATEQLFDLPFTAAEVAQAKVATYHVADSGGEP